MSLHLLRRILKGQVKIVATFKTLSRRSIKKKETEFVKTFQIYVAIKNNPEGSKQCCNIVLKQHQKRRNAGKMSRHGTSLSQHNKGKGSRKKVCRDIFLYCCDTSRLGS